MWTLSKVLACNIVHCVNSVLSLYLYSCAKHEAMEDQSNEDACKGTNIVHLSGDTLDITYPMP